MPVERVAIWVGETRGPVRNRVVPRRNGRRDGAICDEDREDAGSPHARHGHVPGRRPATSPMGSNRARPDPPNARAEAIGRREEPGSQKPVGQHGGTTVLPRKY